jgi:ankyrin repeat protein
MEQKLFELFGHGSTQQIKNILYTNHQIDINWRNHAGETFLTTACANGSYNNVEFLLTGDHPKLDVNIKDNTGRTPFFWCCYWGHQNVVRIMTRDKRVLINEPDNEGKTPLWESAESDDIPVIEEMISELGSKHLDLGQPGDPANDAIGVATRKHNREVVKLLENYKRDPIQTIKQLHVSLGYSTVTSAAMSSITHQLYEEYMSPRKK